MIGFRYSQAAGRRRKREARTFLQRGFSLIEVLIVVGIIAILATLLIPRYANAMAGAQAGTAQANLKQIAEDIELYNTQNDGYPSTSGVVSDTTVSTVDGTPTDGGTGTGHEFDYLYDTPSGAYTVCSQNTHPGSAVQGLATAADAAPSNDSTAYYICYSPADNVYVSTTDDASGS